MPSVSFVTTAALVTVVPSGLRRWSATVAATSPELTSPTRAGAVSPSVNVVVMASLLLVGGHRAGLPDELAGAGGAELHARDRVQQLHAGRVAAELHARPASQLHPGSRHRLRRWLGAGDGPRGEPA